MDSILETILNPKQEELALAVGGLTAASFILYQASASLFKIDEDKKPLPRAPMGILETVRMFTNGRAPITFLQVAKDLGSFNFELNLPLAGHPKVVVISEAEDARDILKDCLSKKPRALYGKMSEMYPAGDCTIFNMQADAEWHRRRRGAAPAFSQKHVRRMSDIAVKHTEKWLKDYLSPLVARNQSFDVVHQMFTVILRAFSETALEYNISDEEIDTFLTGWDLIAKEYILKSASNPFRRYLAPILPERRRARQATHDVLAIFYRVIANYRALDSPIEGTVIDLIMKNPTYKNDHEIAAELTTYMVGGYETTGSSISWTLLALGQHPEVQRSLREKLSNAAQEEWSKSDLLKNVVREGMRWNPVGASAVCRETGRDMVTKKGHFLPKGSFVFMPFYPMFRNYEIFEDADTYKPSRWENPTELMKVAFMPFAAGKQNCIGQSLGNAQLHGVLARMIQEFEFSVEEEGNSECFLAFQPVGLRMKATKTKH